MSAKAFLTTTKVTPQKKEHVIRAQWALKRILTAHAYSDSRDEIRMSIELVIDRPGKLGASAIERPSLLIQRCKGNQIARDGIAPKTILAPAGRHVW